MLILLLLMLIRPTPGMSSIELNPSDPQNTNASMISNCVAVTGSCAVWYMRGTYHIVKPIKIPAGVKDVYLGGVTLVPCSSQVWHMFEAVAPPNAPTFHDMTIKSDSPCGSFTPPLGVIIWYPTGGCYTVPPPTNVVAKPTSYEVPEKRAKPKPPPPPQPGPGTNTISLI